MPALTLDPRRPPVAQQSRLSYQDAALGAFFVPETSNDFTDHGREVSKLRSLQQRQPKDTRTQPDPLEQSPTKTQGDHHHTHRSGRVADPEESAPRAQQKPNQQTICVSYCDTNRTETSLLSVDQLSQDLTILKQTLAQACHLVGCRTNPSPSPVVIPLRVSLRTPMPHGHSSATPALRHVSPTEAIKSAVARSMTGGSSLDTRSELEEPGQDARLGSLSGNEVLGETRHAQLRCAVCVCV